MMHLNWFDDTTQVFETQLNQPFGKDCNTQSFTVQAAFRHVLCPIIKSGFLVGRLPSC
jgi:hypothetical protein